MKMSVAPEHPGRKVLIDKGGIFGFSANCVGGLDGEVLPGPVVAWAPLALLFALVRLSARFRQLALRLSPREAQQQPTASTLRMPPAASPLPSEPY